MTRDTFPGTNLHARAEVTPNLRAARNRARRRLHGPRPAVSTATRKRVGQWRAELKEAYKAGNITADDILYADELLAFPSVTWGESSMCSDATMGRRLDVSASTARRSRRRLDKAGRIEVRGYGVDGNSCLVRPILKDGTPVFPDSERPTPPVTSDHPPRSELTADSFLQTLETEEAPPLPPATEPDAPKEGEKALEQIEDRPPEPQPVEQPETVKPVEPTKPEMSFLQFWLAFGQTGREGYARAQWRKLSPADKAAIQNWLSRPRSRTPDTWAGTWLNGRCWEEAVPTVARPEQVFIRENTPEWRCWQRHLGRSMPVNSQGGWWFASRLPPMLDSAKGGLAMGKCAENAS